MNLLETSRRWWRTSRKRFVAIGSVLALVAFGSLVVGLTAILVPLQNPPSSVPVLMIATTSFEVPDVATLLKNNTQPPVNWQVQVRYLLNGSALVTGTPIKLSMNLTFNAQLGLEYEVLDTKVTIDNAVLVNPQTGQPFEPVEAADIELSLLSNGTKGLLYGTAKPVTVQFTSTESFGGTTKVDMDPNPLLYNSSRLDGLKVLNDVFERFGSSGVGIHNSTQIAIGSLAGYESQLQQQEYERLSLYSEQRANGLAWLVVFFAALTVSITFFEHSAYSREGS